MATQSKKRGPRATVLFKSGTGQGAGAKSQYVYMLRSVAEKLGFKTVPNATVPRKTSKNQKGGKAGTVSVRGSFGAKRVQVPLPGTNSSTAAKKGVSVKYLSVPVPASANISDIKNFLRTAQKKPTGFVSPNGRTYSLENK
ncbi:hypothetical protein NIES4075_34450 [Tolypothrix sp. NIES-4075]|uniref:hypothetical protein n=1 Tax=Tolypothrix sp. NIES-4075 TaxID=2005459 RepID=UPI000B5CD51D|nr:hypothetical protein [Tolypothrix sp. NIES-4075]GAX42444.1 hypothetical protein NIES4075_34450 [Tolypothrix sp. NIES-4075]